MIQEKPMLFSQPLIQPLLQDIKTKTRRVIKKQPDEDGLSRHLLTKAWLDTNGDE